MLVKVNPQHHNARRSFFDLQHTAQFGHGSCRIKLHGSRGRLQGTAEDARVSVCKTEEKEFRVSSRKTENAFAFSSA